MLDIEKSYISNDYSSIEFICNQSILLFLNGIKIKLI